MQIKLKQIQVRDLVEGYVDSQEAGVKGYGGKLDVRPSYQREFVYKDKQRDAVIETLRKNYPLNTMYWVKNGRNYEVLDGQQRTISICQYVTSLFSIDAEYFHTLTEEEQEQILSYKLYVYICEGEEREKLEWFETINVAGEKLTPQELRNAVYTGAWLSDAKKHFSRTGCAAIGLGGDYVKGTPIRQELLQKALKWISNGNIEKYMADSQDKPNASELWLYYVNVINWVKTTFPKTRKKEMQATEWGPLYNEYKDKLFDFIVLEAEIAFLMQDDDVVKKSGIYTYVLTRDEKHLSIRAFTPSQKRQSYEKQKGVCPSCCEKFELSQMEGDHIDPWSQGGKTDMKNLAMLCKPCNRRKSDN